jgi:LacI family transcriptional regulator
MTNQSTSQPASARIDRQECDFEHRFVKYSSGVTMASVAQAAGVATSTVSKALREDPTIPPERRLEIQRIAKNLGYRPNPMVAALMARLHSSRRRNDPHHIAWIDLWPDEREAARTTDFRLMLQGATQRAAELGYQIEVHRVARNGTSAARLHDILVSRSQWGLIIPPVPADAMTYPLALEGLTGVTIGTSLHQPVMHRVASNLFQGSQLACRKLRERGFRRIGLVISPAMNERVERKWLGAFVAEQADWPAQERCPALLISADGEQRFVEWQKRCKPDAVLLAEPHVEDWITRSRAKPRPAIAWLRRIESMPRKTFAIDTRPDKMGAAAVELVVAQIHRNERGSPPNPHTVLLDGVWSD